jgi:cytochrome c oxidase subunit 2
VAAGRIVVLLVAAVTAASACGGDDDASSVSLSADGEAGRSVFQTKGCGSCHGTGVGPDLETVYGSEVELDDGTTVVVDDAYLRRAITDPGAQKVDGYDVTMPTADLSDEEISQLIAYIRDLGGDEGSGGGSAP